MKESITIAASVTLYNSSESSLFSIETYRTQVGRLFVVDNSDIGDGRVISQLKKYSNVVCLSNEGNKGVGAALNRAAEAAIAEGFSHLLTMDDDTSVPSDLVDKMTNFLVNCQCNQQIGILSAVHSKDMISNAGHRRVLTTMTSGNLLNLSAYKKIGPFRTDFFIDHIDHEYNLRLNLAGYVIIELPALYLRHNLGECKQLSWGRLSYVSHTPVRGYYIIRNGLIIIKEYGSIFPVFRRRVRTLLVKEILKAVFLEPQKWYRLKLFWQGAVDAYSKRLGKLAE